MPLDLPYVLLLIIFIIFFLWPNESLLLILPGLLPTVNIDIGLGVTPIRMIVLAAFIGQLLRGQWKLSIINKINKQLLWGWIILITSFLISAFYNDEPIFPNLGIWLVRMGLMLLYISAWRFVRNIDFGYWGWVISGLFMVWASLVIYLTTKDVLAIRNYSPVWENEYTPFSIAGFFLLVASLSIMAFWSCWSLYGLKKIHLSGALIISFSLAFPILMSGRRQAILAMVLSILLFIISIPSNKKMLINTVILLMILSTWQLGLLGDFFEGRESISDELTGGGTGRYWIYSMGINAFIEKPIIGWGPGEYKDVMKLYGVINLQTGEGVASHNTFIGIAVESGIIGLIGFLLILIGLIKRTLFLTRVKEENVVFNKIKSYTLPIIGFILAGFLVSNLVEAHWYLLSMALIFGITDRFQLLHTIHKT